MKIFISQPMRDKTEEEILTERNKIINKVKAHLGEDTEFIDLINDEKLYTKNKPVWHLGKSIQLLSQADGAVFVKGWKNARGCRLEHEICKYYGIPIINWRIPQ